MNVSDTYIWMIILALSVGSFLVRFSFIGLIGHRTLPKPIERALGYTSVAVLPGIAAPMVLTQGVADLDPARVIAALLTVVVGAVFKSLLLSLLAGIGSFFILTSVL